MTESETCSFYRRAEVSLNNLHLNSVDEIMATQRNGSDTIISTVAPHLQQPIADFVAKLIARRFRQGDSVSAGFYENGYSIAAILLLTAMVESMLQRDRYFLQQSNPASTVSGDSSVYLKESLRYRRHSHVRELFDLRNALAHNHMWEVEYALTGIGARAHRQSKLVPRSHRLKDLPSPNAKIPRTRAVRFNLLPSRVDRTDLVKALDVCNHALMHLNKRGKRPVRFLDDTVVCGKQRMPFKELAEALRNAF